MCRGMIDPLMLNRARERLRLWFFHLEVLAFGKDAADRDKECRFQSESEAAAHLSVVFSALWPRFIPDLCGSPLVFQPFHELPLTGTRAGPTFHCGLLF